MKRLLSLLTVVTFVAIPNYSYAQNTDLVLEEVVVKATKKQENVQDIAQTVNAVMGSTLDDYQIKPQKNIFLFFCGFNNNLF